MTTPTERHTLTWPDDLRPDRTPIYTYNELFIPASAEVIWSWLIRASGWPGWYGNCKNVRYPADDGPDLAAGTVFTWTTFGVRVTTQVVEFEPFRKLAWRGRGLGAAGYHGWLLYPQPGGCLVVTEETQRGLVPSLGRIVLRRGLLREHQHWLEGLARMARRGPAHAVQES